MLLRVKKSPLSSDFWFLHKFLGQIIYFNLILTSNSSTSNTQYENLNTSNQTFFSAGLSVSNTSKQDSSSLNSEDSNEQRNNSTDHSTNLNNNLNNNNNNINLLVPTSTSAVAEQNASANNGSMSARSAASINGSISFDLLDQLKISNGSDIDSEGYSIRPDSSIGESWN